MHNINEYTADGHPWLFPPERRVRQDWEQNGRTYINKKCFDDCWHRIWEWLHLPTLKDYLKKHRVLTTPDDLDLITNSLRGPKERADSIVQRIVPKAGRFGYYLLYMCIRDDITGNLLGHKDAVKELEAYGECSNVPITLLKMGCYCSTTVCHYWDMSVIYSVYCSVN